MLIVRLEVAPQGDRSRSRDIGRMHLGNDGAGAYDGVAFDSAGHPRVAFQVTGHTRADGAWSLVQAALVEVQRRVLLRDLTPSAGGAPSAADLGPVATPTASDAVCEGCLRERDAAVLDAVKARGERDEARRALEVFAGKVDREALEAALERFDGCQWRAKKLGWQTIVHQEMVDAIVAWARGGGREA